MNRIILACALLLSSCNNGSSSGADASLLDSSQPRPDQSVARDLGTGPDLSLPTDLSVPDDLATLPDQSRPPGDLAGPGCKSDLVCRLYSNMCKDPMPCICIPLPVGVPDPVCVGPMVLCFMDPCSGKKPACISAMADRAWARVDLGVTVRLIR